MPSDVIDEADVWDVFDHLIHTRTRGKLHLPTEESMVDDPEKRCIQGEEAANLVGSPVEAIPKDTERVCGHCIADVNGTTAGGAGGADVWESRRRIGELVKSMGGTPP